MKRSWLYTVIAIVVIALLGWVLWPYAFTVVPIAQIEKAQASEAFDPVAYVDKIWSSQILPAFDQKSVDLPTVLSSIKPDDTGMVKKDDLTPVAKEYGLITVGEADVFMVKGSGKVTAVDTSSSVGFMTVQLDGYNGPIQIKILIGPRIPSDETSVRDATGLINFGDFKEQTEFGKVASEINKRVSTQVLANLPKDQLQGKQVTFTGTFTIRTFNLVTIDVKEIDIVPVKIEVK